MLLVSWALDNQAAVRVSFAELVDGEVRRYRHLLLGEPVRAPWERTVRLRPVRVHAGGIAWAGSQLWVADTLRGLRAFAVDEILELASGELVLPQVGAHRLSLAATLTGGPRFSFLSLVRPASGPPELLSGEYRDNSPGARIVRWPLPEPGEPVAALDAFPVEPTNLQAVLALEGRLLLCSSAGRRPGHLTVCEQRGRSVSAVHRWATGPEDLTHLPGRGLVFSLTERPHDPRDCPGCGRVVYAVGAAAVLGAA